MTEWQSRKLGDLVDILSGFAFDSKGFGDAGNLPVVRIRDVTNGSSATFYRGSYDEKFIIRTGDLLIGMDGEFNRAKWRGGDALLNQRVCRIASSSKALDDSYLFHFLPSALQEIERKTPFVTVKHLSVKQIREIEISLPPIQEQRRIAEVLDRAEALRAKRRAALAQLDTLTQAIFLDMFGNERDILEKWPVRQIGEVLDFLTSGSRGWAKYYSEEGDLFLRIQNVKRDELSLHDIAYVRPPETAEAKRTLVEPGDVLLSITADLGRTAVVPPGLGSAYINQHLAILRTRSLVPRFLSAFLNSPSGQRQIAGKNRHGVKAGLNFDDIRSFSIPVPSSALQQKFVVRANKIEQLKELQQKSRVQFDRMFESLQNRAFEGAL